MPKNMQSEMVKAVVSLWIGLLLNPRFLLCFGIGWMITNGWAYVMLGFGVLFDIGWATAVAGAYLTLLWIPMTPEKLLTLAIAILLLRRFFPNDEKTLGVLREIFSKTRLSFRRRRHKWRRRFHSMYRPDAME